jgi:hypothetical protein
MPQQPGTLESIATSLAKLLAPLEERIQAGDIRLLLAELGLNFPPAVEADAALASSTQVAVQKLQGVPVLVAALAAALQDEDIPAIIAKGLDLANTIRAVIDAVTQVANAIRAAGAGAGIPAAELNQFADQLPGKLIDYVVVRNLEAIPGLADGLDFIGFVERTDVSGVDATHPPFTRRSLHFDALSSFLQDPASQLQARYGWGSGGFDGTALLQKLNRLLAAAGVPAVLDTSGPVPVLDVIFLEISPRLDVNPRGLQLKIALPFDAGPQSFQQDQWSIRLIANNLPGVGAAILFQPNDAVTITAPSTVQGDVAIEFTAGTSTGTPYTIVGAPGGSRLSTRQFILRAGAGFAWNAATGQGQGSFTIAGQVKYGKLVISLSGADGFLSKVLSGFWLESDFEVGLGFSTKDGLFFQGSATLEIQLPMHVSLGPVDLSALTLTAGLAADALPLGLALDIKAMLGPLQAVIEQVGITGNLRLPADHHGNAGPVDFSLAFRPPKGVGLSIDAGVVKGGGYLFIDADRGEYAGALELTFSGFLALKAIGIITTRMPDGSQGFSLLIIITAEFGTGIQLGFGFTLLAVGGLIGLNRTMRLQALMDGIRTGAIESIMFPHDVIANAPRIISDLRAIFSPQEGRFLIGPMAKLGWGTPTLISISLGIIIEIPPGNIAILGILKVALPADDAALIIIQVNFAGALEFDKKRLYFFAALFESRIVFVTIEGEMGLLAAFGDDANFVVSVGGFHPQFNPPPLPFPSPRRILVSLVNSPIARVRIEGYFAVTSNTVQFGAAAELFFGLDAVNVQGHIAFDALFQFSPFMFIIHIAASFSVNVFGIGLFSIDIDASLEGPSPYHVSGHASISLLFFDISVDIDVTWGESTPTTLPPIEVMPLFIAEFNKDANWRALPPPSSNLLVTLRKLPEDEAALVLHPVGVLRVSQRALPLDLKLDKVGNQKPSDVNRLAVGVAGGGLAKRADAPESFAAAQFQDMSDADKLSRPAFQPMHGGIDLGVTGADQRSSKMVKRIVRYDTTIIDSNYKRFSRRFFGFNAALFQFFLNGASVTRSEMSRAYKKRLRPFEDKIEVAHEQYTVAFQANNKAYSTASATFDSEAMARDFMARTVDADPELADTLHVIPAYERAL